METGRRKDKSTGKPIPAHYITEMIASLGDKKLVEADLGPGVSTNPLYSFKFKGGAKGGTIKIHWTDNKGNNDSKDVTIG
jgi:sulfur-oxidizing protein SoxZ